MALAQYRVRAYEDNYEVMDERVHLVALDLGDARGLAMARAELDDVHARLARALKLRTEDARASLRLSVHEYPSGMYVMDWVA